MAPKPAYSVITVTFNHAPFIEGYANALSTLDPPPQEVVIADNASQDETLQALKKLASNFPIPITLIPNTTNTGFSAAANQAIRKTTAPWVLSLNPDCAPKPNFVANLLATLENLEPTKRNRVGALTGKLLRASDPSLSKDTGILDSTGMVMTKSGRHLDRGSGEKDHGQYEHLEEVFGGTGAATLYRRKALQDIAYPPHEYFAENFFAYREDAELAWRLRLRGWRCYYAPQAVALHWRGLKPEAGRKGHHKVNMHSVKNRFLLRIHCADMAWHMACFPHWLVRDLLVVAACLTIEPRSIPGLIGVLTGMREALKRRRWVMKRRNVRTAELIRWFT